MKAHTTQVRLADWIIGHAARDPFCWPDSCTLVIGKTSMNDPLAKLLGAFGMIILFVAAVYICLWVIPTATRY